MPTHTSITAESIAAASVYMASHILNQPRTLMEVARLVGVSERKIYRIYKAINYSQSNLVDDDWREFVSGTTLLRRPKFRPLSHLASAPAKVH